MSDQVEQAKKLIRDEWKNGRLLPGIFNDLMTMCDSIVSTATTPQTEWSEANVYTSQAGTR